MVLVQYEKSREKTTKNHRNHTAAVVKHWTLPKYQDKDTHIKHLTLSFPVERMVSTVYT